VEKNLTHLNEFRAWCQETRMPKATSSAMIVKPQAYTKAAAKSNLANLEHQKPTKLIYTE
jgi:hypothetical protein